MKKINVQGLGEIEVDDNFFKLSPKEQNDFVDQAVIQDAITGTGKAFMSGMLFNFRDEVVAALSEPKSFIESFSDESKGQAYRKELTRQRLLESAFRRKEPGLAIGSEILGGVLVPGGAIGTAARSGTALARLAKTSGAGAGLGAAAGLGAGTDAESRGQKAAEFGATGAVLAPVVAAAVPAAQAVTVPVVRTAGRLFEAGVSEPSVRAARMVARRLKEAGVTGDALEALKKDPKPMALADIDSKGVQSLARLVAQSPGKGAELARNLDVRQFGDDAVEGAAKRIEQDLIAAGVPRQTALEAKSVIDQIKGAKAADAYKASNSFQVTSGLRAKLKPIFDRPSMTNIIGQAKRLAAEEGKPFSGTTIDNIDMNGLDYIQRALNKKINRAYMTADTQMGKAIKDTRQEFVDILDNANPAFAAARSMYADASARQSALELGRKFKTMRSEGEISEATKGFGADEMHNFRTGMAQSIRDDLEGARSGADFASKIAGNQRQIRQFREAFPEESIKPLEEALSKESQMAATRSRVMGGTQTFQTSAEAMRAGAEDLTMAQRGMSGARQGGLVGAATEAVEPLARQAISAVGPRTSRELGNLLFATDPAARAAAISRVQQARGFGRPVGAPVVPQTAAAPSMMRRAGQAASSATPRGLLFSTGQQVAAPFAGMMSPISSAQASSLEDMAAGGNIVGYESGVDRQGNPFTFAKMSDGRAVRVR